MPHGQGFLDHIVVDKGGCKKLQRFRSDIIISPSDLTALRDTLASTSLYTLPLQTAR